MNPTVLTRVMRVACLALLCAAVQTTGARAADLSDPDAYRQAQDYTLLLINEARNGQGLRPVNSDPLAAQAARNHAEEMLQGGYLSHWNMDGLKPTRRYNLLGGYHAVAENIYFALNGPQATQDMLDKAMHELMDSAGHRRTILDPAHTHAGIGLALSSDGSRFYLVQEFVTRVGGEYRCPLTAHIGERIEFSGRIDSARYNVEHAVLGFEERPGKRDRRWLSRTGIYKEGEKAFAGYSPNMGVYYPDMLTFHDIEVDADTGHFRCLPVMSYKDREGLYYIFLWLREKAANAEVLAAVASVDVTK
jgi:uncharacterized protein YkwD